MHVAGPGRREVGSRRSRSALRAHPAPLRVALPRRTGWTPWRVALVLLAAAVPVAIVLTVLDDVVSAARAPHRPGDLTIGRSLFYCTNGIHPGVWLGLAAAVFIAAFHRGPLDAGRAWTARLRARRRGATWWADRAWGDAADERRLARGTPETATLLLVVVVHVVLGVACLRFVTPVREAHLVIVLALVLGAIAAWPWFAHGRLVVARPALPQWVGDELRFHVGVSPGGARIESPRVALACLRDSVAEGGLRRTAPHVLWCGEARRSVSGPLGPDTDHVVAFRPPAELPGTDLRAGDPVHWELVVTGVAGGRDVRLCVPVPVYRRAEPEPEEPGAGGDRA